MAKVFECEAGIIHDRHGNYIVAIAKGFQVYRCVGTHAVLKATIAYADVSESLAKAIAILESLQTQAT